LILDFPAFYFPSKVGGGGGGAAKELSGTLET